MWKAVRVRCVRLLRRPLLLLPVVCRRRLLRCVAEGRLTPRRAASGAAALVT